MANKLRSIFNNDDIYIKGTIKFSDKKSSDRFREALETIYENGEAAKIDENATITLSIKPGAGLIPLEEYEQVTNLEIGISPERKQLPLIVDDEETIFPVDVYYIKDGCIIQTPFDYVIFTKLILHPNAKTASIKITPQYKYADNVESVLESIRYIDALIDALFVDGNNDHNSGVKKVRVYLNGLYDIFDRLLFVENSFDLKFFPKQIDFNNQDSLRDLYELCLVLRDKRIIRFDKKLTSPQSTGDNMNTNSEIKEGEPVELTFLGEIEYGLWGELIKLYTSNLLCNAIVKSIDVTKEGGTHVIYGDLESKPMYISYRGYKTEEEAREELEHMVDDSDNKEAYENAKTAAQYWKEEDSCD